MGEFAARVPGWRLAVECFGVLSLEALTVEVDAVLGERPVGEVYLGQDSGRELSIAGDDCGHGVGLVDGFDHVRLLVAEVADGAVGETVGGLVGLGWGDEVRVLPPVGEGNVTQVGDGVFDGAIDWPGL